VRGRPNSARHRLSDRRGRKPPGGTFSRCAALCHGVARAFLDYHTVILRPAIEAEEFWTFEQNGTVAPVFESPHRI